MLHQGALSGVFWTAIVVVAALAFSYFTERTMEVGNIKIGAVPQVEDPEMQRCKAVQALVENKMRSAFTDVKNALALSMRDTQDKEVALITIWSNMAKSTPDDIHSLKSIVDDIRIPFTSAR